MMGDKIHTLIYGGSKGLSCMSQVGISQSYSLFNKKKIPSTKAQQREGKLKKRNFVLKD